MEKQQIIDRLFLVGKHFRLSNTALAEKSGIAPSNYSQMLKGEQTITDKTLRKISNAFGLRFEWLLFGDGEMLTCKNDVTTNTQVGDNNSNVQSSPQLIEKALDEIAAQRRLTENTQRLLEQALQVNKEQSNAILNILNSK